MHGPNRVQDTILDDAGVVEKTLFRCEDQLGSLIGVTDATGRKTDEYAYLDYGAPVRREIRLDLPRVDIYSVEDIALTPFFYINLASASSPAADLQGRCITAASPEDANGNFWNVANIVEVGTREVAPGVTKGYLKVLDGEKNMLDALANNETLGATVYTFHDKATYGSALQHTFGEWSHTPVNTGGTTGTTAFRDTAGDIKTFMKGWLLVPAVTELGYLEITNVDTSLDKVIVKGDADTLSGIGQRYWLVAPAGVNPETGAIETDPCKMGSPWLWAGYHYRAPIVGFSNPPGQSAGTYGAQTGNNKLGNYQCWNRVYEPNTGRWTTPDPAMSPWWNTWDYAHSQPLQRSDPHGLDDSGEIDQFDGDATVTMETPTLRTKTGTKNREVCMKIRIETDSPELGQLLMGQGVNEKVRLDTWTMENVDPPVGEDDWKYPNACGTTKKNVLRNPKTGELKLTEVVGPGGKKHWEFEFCLDQEPCTGKACGSLGLFDNDTEIKITLKVSIEARKTIKVGRAKLPDTKFDWQSVTLDETITVDCEDFK
ncbi:MAG: hypothetical protein HS108_00550 [Planctomycetes bacterium]|jgi:RHS repeat-associated protein|nr:hypothetical protein [Planctomycetota bacterium]